MALTRFKDARAGKDGPVSGAIIVIPVQFDDVANNETVFYSTKLPAGMRLEIVSIDVRAGTATGDPKLTVGTARAGAQIVASVTVTTDLGPATLVATEVDGDDELDVRIVADANDVIEDGSVTITAYVSGPPTSLLIRGDQGHI